MASKFKGKKILVLGLSKSGISAAKHLAKVGSNVFLTEKREKTNKDTKILTELKNIGIKGERGGHSDKFIKGTNIAVTSPGIPPHSEIIQKLTSNNIPVISEIEVAYNESKVPFIAITGTNGKTTTTALTDFIFKTT